MKESKDYASLGTSWTEGGLLFAAGDGGGVGGCSSLEGEFEWA